MSDLKNKGKRVLLGLSGGVDSALAALILQQQGYEVIAARMRVYVGPDIGLPGVGCYGRSDADDTASAESLAKKLGIPFITIDLSHDFKNVVLSNFCSEYQSGRTPNPCVRCNELIKFNKFPELARQAGAEFDLMATGHYARIDFSPKGHPRLLRGLDRMKDQSYFLYRLSSEQLAHTIFPLGDFTKVETRKMAADQGLPVHDRPDSQDFFGGNYLDLMNIPDKKGLIVDTSGRKLGEHFGHWRFTPGQRKGLGVCRPMPLYVLKIDPNSNEVVVGPAEENIFKGCFIQDLKFGGANQSPPPAGTVLQARLRSSQPLIEAQVGEFDENGRLEVIFTSPQPGLAPGQSLVFYDDEVVVGGGLIAL